MDLESTLRSGQKGIFYANAIFYMKSLGIVFTTINYYREYDDMLTIYIQSDIYKTESMFLKKGIEEIYNALKQIEKITIKSKESIRNDLFEKHNGKTELITQDRLPMDDERFQKYLDVSSNNILKDLTENNKNSLILLKYELIQFKIKLSRIGYEIMFLGDNVSFISTLQIGDKNIILDKNTSSPRRNIELAIEDHLDENLFLGNGYEQIKSAIIQYFTENTFPVFNEKIKLIRANKKKIGWSLNNIYREHSASPLSFKYVNFFKENLNIYENDELNESSFRDSNIYKYFTQKYP